MTSITWGVDTIILLILSGLTKASLLFIVAAGLSLVFGVLRIINLAHGSFYMIGAFIAASIVMKNPEGPSFWLAIAIAPFIVAILGWIIELAVLRRIYRSEHIVQLLATYALILILGDVVRMIWGAEYISISFPQPLTKPVNIMGSYFPSYNLFVIAWAPVIALFLWWFVYKTGIGCLVRAAVSDAEMLDALGINIQRIFSIVFTIGAFLSALGGIIVSPMGSIGLGMDLEILIEAFVVAVIGGLGSFAGALLGSVIIGLMHSFGITIAPRMAMAFIFLAMVIVLVIRPWGIFGEKER